MLSASSLTRTPPVGSTILGKLTLLVKGLKTHFIRTKLTAGRPIHRGTRLFLVILHPTIGTRLVDPSIASNVHTRLQNQNLDTHQEKHGSQRNRHIRKPWNGIQRIENAHIV
jgi:hypothetical protein